MPVDEPSFLDSLTENPTLPVAGLGLVALLAGYGVYKARQRKKRSAPDSSFMASRLQPDSFFGASGGQRVNTKNTDSPSGNSSMAYSPSQLDAAGDVDPVAEADVYLAYGRDMQAEEILKEALRTQPNRIAVHRKLAEIYLKRRDTRALQAIAEQAYPITEGWGPDWEYIRGLGAELDPANRLYQPGGQPVPRVANPVQPRHAFGADTEPQTAHVLGDQDPVLPMAKRSVDPVRSNTPGEQQASAAAKTPTMAAPHVLGGSIPGMITADGLAMAPFAATSSSASRGAAPVAPGFGEPASMIDFELDLAPPVHADVGQIKSGAQPAAYGSAHASPLPDAGVIEFNLDAPELQTGAHGAPAAQAAPASGGALDPLETKMALAQEFWAIGDLEGARALAREVVAESHGALKSRAERLLIDLG